MSVEPSVVSAYEPRGRARRPGSRMLRRARRSLFGALRRAGVFDTILNSQWRSRRLLILCYHGLSVADEHEWNGELYMRPEVFRGRLDTLARGGYAVLPLDEALTRVAAGTLPSRAVTITFDDGSHDLYDQAIPLLERHGYPFTVYLTTYYCEFQRPVFDTACSYVLWRGRRPTIDLDDLVPGGGLARIDTPASRRAVLFRLRAAAVERRLSGAAKDDLLCKVAGRLDVDYEAIARRRLFCLMRADELRDVSRRRGDVELHTHRHRTPDDRDGFLKEIHDNREAIGRILGPGSRVHFCYPSGVHKPAYLEWLREDGVRSATTTDAGLVSAEDNALLLPRFVDTSGQSPLDFEAWLTGTAAWLRGRQQRPSLRLS